MQLNKCKVVVACAGSRKTTSIVEQALACVGKRVLITTYTNENVNQINSYLVEQAGAVPSNIKVVSWYSFLLQDGVRPYQNHLTTVERVNSIDFLSDAPFYYKRTDPRFYFGPSGDIYAERVSDFIHHCNAQSGGLVVGRLEKVYDYIFVDELQDFAGYDLDLLETLFRSSILVVAVGDPRQATFVTNHGPKNKQFKKGNILDWISLKERQGLFVVEHRTDCYRSNQLICDFADELFPGLPKTTSKNATVTDHDGIFEIGEADVMAYVEKHRPVILRHDRRAKTFGLPAFNIGLMKGKTFDRVLVFPTAPMKHYLQNKDLAKAGDLTKFYVAVTRARFSVTFVV